MRVSINDAQKNNKIENLNFTRWLIFSLPLAVDFDLQCAFISLHLSAFFFCLNHKINMFLYYHHLLGYAYANDNKKEII